MTNNKTLALYGSKQDLQKMAGRIKSLMPGGNRLNNEQAMALAQVALIHGLDPFNGEVWYIVDDNGKSLGIQIGIKGLRKTAHKQVQGNYWTSPRMITDEKERAALQIKPGDLAFEMRLFDTETFATYTGAVKQLRDAGIPFENVVKILGEAPYTLGYGVFKSGERSKMTPVQCAMKRAESHAIKQRFDVPFETMDTDEPESIGGSQVIDAEFIEAATPPAQTVNTITGEVVEHDEKHDTEKDAADLFGKSKPLSPEAQKVERVLDEVEREMTKPLPETVGGRVLDESERGELGKATEGKVAVSIPDNIAQVIDSFEIISPAGFMPLLTDLTKGHYKAIQHVAPSIKKYMGVEIGAWPSVGPKSDKATVMDAYRKLFKQAYAAWLIGHPEESKQVA